MFSTARPIIVPFFNFAAHIEAAQTRYLASMISRALSQKFRSFAEDRKLPEKKPAAENQILSTVASEESLKSSKKLQMEVIEKNPGQQKKATELSTIKMLEEKDSSDKIMKIEEKCKKLGKKIRKQDKKVKETSFSSIDKQISLTNFSIENEQNQVIFQATIPRLKKMSMKEMEQKRQNLLSRKVLTWPEGQSKRVRNVKLFQ